LTEAAANGNKTDHERCTAEAANKAKGLSRAGWISVLRFRRAFAMVPTLTSALTKVDCRDCP